MKRYVMASGITLLLVLGMTATLPNYGDDRMSNFYNVISQDGADPWVYKHTDGTYYYIKTTGNNVTLRRSTTLSGIEVGQSKVLWKPEGQTSSFGNIWAPEIHYLDQRWYVYFAATSADKDHRMYVLENSAEDPFSGEWLFKGQITDSTDKWAIDGTVLEVNERRYFIWSGWEGDVNVRQNLYVAEMSNPWTIQSERVEISRPQHAWETNHTPHVNEGPQVVVKNDTINLVYSASGSWTNDYSLGLMTAKISDDLLDPESWVKQDRPVFRSANGLYGPGHHSFTRSPDDSEDWLIYHTAKWQGAGWARLVRAQPYEWNEDDTPSLGKPVHPDEPIPIPSGEKPRQRYEAEAASLSQGMEVVNDAGASNGKKVVLSGKGEQFIYFDVYVEQDGAYALFSRFKNGNSSKRTLMISIHINEKDQYLQAADYSSYATWIITGTVVDLKKGKNKVVIKQTSGKDIELDFIELLPF